MTYTFIKIVISAALITAISEAAKRSALLGSILASLPLVSVLAIVWLYIDTRNVDAVGILSRDIFWLVLPSLLLFILLPFLLKQKIGFYLALLFASAATVIGYFFMIILLRKFGIRI